MRKRESATNKMSLNILQLNCQRSHSVMNDLSVFLTDMRVNVALLQQLYITNDRVTAEPMAGIRLWACTDQGCDNRV